MLYPLAATLTLLLHLAFIVFVIAGAAAAWRWRWMPVIHLPAAAWGIFVELSGRGCPLTQLENYFRLKAGQSGYAVGFIEHYLLAAIYPSGLSAEIQLMLAGLVILTNIVLYAWLIRDYLRRD